MYDAEYIRELTAARKANEVARALIKDHEATIVAQREQLVKLRCGREWWKAAAKRWRARARGIAPPEVEAVLRHENMLLYVKAERLEEELIALRMDSQSGELDALRVEVAALRAQVEAQP